jgi:predicted  nucleic acid-binding Zn-ribbon protein
MPVRLALALLLLSGTAAFGQPAQDQPPASNEVKALGSMVMDAAQREAQLRAQVFTLQDEIARLKTQAKVAENKQP